MTGLDLRYDGIVYQYVGELLLDLPETRAIRFRCLDSYWASLQKFVFGYIFGRRLIIPATHDGGILIPTKMPPLFVGGPTPGEILLTELFPEKRFPEARPKNAVTVEQL